MKASTQTSTVQDRRGTTHKPARTLWLTIARSGWLGVTGMCLLLLIVALPVRYAQLAAPPPQVRAGLPTLGLPLSLYVFYNLILDSCVVLGFFAAAALLFWRKSDEWFPLLVVFLLVTFGIDGPLTINATTLISSSFTKSGQEPTCLSDYMGHPFQDAYTKKEACRRLLSIRGGNVPLFDCSKPLF